MVSGLGNVWVNGQIISTNKGEKELWIESKDIELDTRAHKYIDTFSAELKDAGETGAKLKLGWRDRLEDPIKWSKWFPMSDLDKIQWLRMTGRFIRIRIEDVGPQTIWKLSAIELFGHAGGGRL